MLSCDKVKGTEGSPVEELKLYVISHTHWDREWYQPFQMYRYRLVRMMDRMIEDLEGNGDFSVFHLDGQMPWRRMALFARCGR